MLHHLLKLSSGSEPGFAAKSIRWQVNLASDGSVVGSAIPLGDERFGERHPRVPDMHNMTSGRAHFLVENVSTVALLFAADADERERTKVEKRHRYFVDLLREAARACPQLHPLAVAVGNDARTDALRQAFPGDAKPAEWMKFTMEGRDPLTDEDILAWWRSWRQRDLAGDGGGPSKRVKKPLNRNRASMVDVLTGQAVVPASTHPKVTGFAGVVSFDKEAFQSFGLSQSSNAAMSEQTARRYVDALKDIMSQRSFHLGGAKVAYWFKEALPKVDDPFEWLSDPPGAQEASAHIRARELLQSIREGRRPNMAGNVYYALTMSKLEARYMVRDWMEGDFPSLVSNVSKWFSDLEICGLGGESGKDRKFESVLTSLLPMKPPEQKYADWIRPLGPIRVALFRAALTDRTIPHQVESKLAVLLPAFLAGKSMRDALDEEYQGKKLSKDAGLTISTLYARMGLIKAYFIRKGATGMSVSLNTEHPDPAYHCGRLLAALAGLQRSALGDVGAGVVQRYYAGAAQRPGLIFGDLVRNSNNHLHKLEPNIARQYEDSIGEIVGRMKEFPRTLDLERQTVFALGYYHQLVHDRKGA